MFVFTDEEIKKLSQDGFYDFITDKYDGGELFEDDKEEIYHEMLYYMQDNLNEAQMTEFLNKVNETLKIKRNYEIEIEAENESNIEISGRKMANSELDNIILPRTQSLL